MALTVLGISAVDDQAFLAALDPRNVAPVARAPRAAYAFEAIATRKEAVRASRVVYVRISSVVPRGGME